MSGIANEVDQLRAEIAALGSAKHLRRYPRELRGRIAKHARRRRAGGESQAAIAKSLDMSDPTLARFVADDRNPGRDRRPRVRSRAQPVRALVPVKVRPEVGARVAGQPKDERVVVRGPSGLVIEGLTISALAELIAGVAACSA